MDMKDLYNNAFDYYKTYLKQRADNFNFFLVLAGFITSALAIIFVELDANNKLAIITIPLSIFLSVISFLFSMLDNRTREFLIKTEEILMSYEKEINANVKKLFTEVDILRKNGTRKITMRKVFRTIYIMFFVLGLTGFIGSLIFIAR